MTEAAHSVEDWIERAHAQYSVAPAAAIEAADRALAALPDGALALRAWALCARGLARITHGQANEGLRDLLDARSHLPALDDLRTVSRIERAHSIAWELLGVLDLALEHACAAHAAAIETDSELDQANARLSVGVALSRWGRFEQGLAVYRELEPVFGRLGLPERRIAVLNNIAINLKNLQRYGESLEASAEGEAIAAQHGLAVLAAVLVANKTDALLALGRAAEALGQLREAERTLSAAGHVSGRLQALLGLGCALDRLGRHDEALAPLDTGLRVAVDAGQRACEARMHEAMASVLRNCGQHAGALAHYMTFHDIDRAMFNEASDRKLGALQVRFEIERARREAEIERLRNVELSRAHAELQALHGALIAADREKTGLLERLAEQSRTDALTGLANRRRLDERLSEEYARARRYAHPLAVAMCDIDDFKRINDSFGHALGDEVLRALGALLLAECRETDLVARYGGEEFCIVFVETDVLAAIRVCESVRQAVASYPWSALHAGLQVTISIGLSDLTEFPSHELLLADADAQLYVAKSRGKDQVRCGRLVHGASHL